MPTIVHAEITGYAHCRNALCQGYHQEEVPALRVETSQTYGDNGGDNAFRHMTERSFVEFRFADESDVPCQGCGQAREVTGEPRPQYEAISGYDPLGLLKVGRFDQGRQMDRAARVGTSQESDEEIEARVRARLLEESIEKRLREEA